MVCFGTRIAQKQVAFRMTSVTQIVVNEAQFAQFLLVHVLLVCTWFIKLHLLYLDFQCVLGCLFGEYESIHMAASPSAAAGAAAAASPSAAAAGAATTSSTSADLTDR